MQTEVGARGTYIHVVAHTYGFTLRVQLYTVTTVHTMAEAAESALDVQATHARAPDLKAPHRLLNVNPQSTVNQVSINDRGPEHRTYN